jgi:DNA-directed RNA polymerase subunit RPC12/RpoP
MIHFRCWFCNRAFLMDADRTGARLRCRNCGARLKVPREAGGSSKYTSVTDRVVESLVYGGAGAVIGFVVWLLTFGRIPGVRRRWEILAALVGFGLVVGVVFGERGIGWIGQKFRDRGLG